MSLTALIKREEERLTIAPPKDIRRIPIDGLGEYANIVGRQINRGNTVGREGQRSTLFIADGEKLAVG